MARNNDAETIQAIQNLLSDGKSNFRDSRRTRKPEDTSSESKKLNTSLEDASGRLAEILRRLDRVNSVVEEIEVNSSANTKELNKKLQLQDGLRDSAEKYRNIIKHEVETIVTANKRLGYYVDLSDEINMNYETRLALLRAMNVQEEDINKVIEEHDRLNTIATYQKRLQSQIEEQNLSRLEKSKRKQEEISNEIENRQEAYEEMIEKATEAEEELQRTDISESRRNELLSKQDFYKKAAEQEYLAKQDKEKEYQKEQNKANLLSGMFGNDSLLTKAITSGIKGADLAKAIGDVVMSGINKLSAFTDNAVTDAVNAFSQHQAAISARLQGSYLDSTEGAFREIASYVDTNIGTNVLVSQKQLLGDIRRLTDNGIAFNLEERAVLSNLADKMVTTFDALDTNLTRLIRLQNADLTAAQLGAESFLTQLLNSQFQDTSYLDSMYDSVMESLMEANSQMTSEMTVAFDSVVQKWLGSMYSVGMSKSAVSSIAQGIGYLASGNVSALSSNSGLQTLLVSAANLGGLSYADMLNRGMSMDETNRLLESVVKYLQSIDDNTDTNVTRSAMTSILGLSVSDLRAIRNLDSGVIGSLSGLTNNQTLNNFLGYTKQQLELVNTRMTATQMIDNYMDNLKLSIGGGLAQDTTAYLQYRTTQMVTNIVSNMAGGLAGSILKTIGGGISTWQTLKAAGGFNKLLEIGGQTADEFNLNSISGNAALGDQSASNIISLLDLGNIKTVVRGEAAASPGVINTSYSTDIGGSAFGNTSISDIEYNTLSRQADQASYTGQNIAEGAEVGIKDVNDVYSQLFEQRKAVRVSLLDAENDELFNLLRALKTRVVDGIVDVDVISNDVDAIRNAIYSIKVG